MRYRVMLDPQHGNAPPVVLNVMETTPWRAAQRLFVLEWQLGWNQESRPWSNVLAHVLDADGEFHPFALWEGSIEGYRRRLAEVTP